MPRLIDHVGDVFGRLTVISRTSNERNGQARWHCKCSCGGTLEVCGDRLRLGKTRSCGCLRKETTPLNAVTIHGHASPGNQSPTYKSWISMKQRCTNPHNCNWKNYGGRGIKVCDRWFNSFVNFLTDMGERPDGRTIDRYPDPYGNYELANCRWATPAQQQHNRRDNTCAI